MSFAERSIILCPYLGGSTVLILKMKLKAHLLFFLIIKHVLQLHVVIHCGLVTNCKRFTDKLSELRTLR